MSGLGSIPNGGNILSLDFLFSRSNAADASIGIFVQFVKHPIECVCSAIFHHIIIMCLQCDFPSHNNNFSLTNVYTAEICH